MTVRRKLGLGGGGIAALTLIVLVSSGAGSASAAADVSCSGKSKPVHEKLTYQFTCQGSFAPTEIEILPKAPNKPHGTLLALSASRVRALDPAQSSAVDMKCQLKRLRKGSWLDCPRSSQGPDPILSPGVTATGTLRLAADPCKARIELEMLLPEAGTVGSWQLRRTGCKAH
jgi:hypothetical protein